MKTKINNHQIKAKCGWDNGMKKCWNTSTERQSTDKISA
jgi:hypothetical protein